jgi:hypothetical protein
MVIFNIMLPKTFYKENNKKRNKLLSEVKLFTISYDYKLNPYYADYIKESYDRWGNIVDILGIMKLTGYNKLEVEHNFHQIMVRDYVNTKKIKSFNVTSISHQ